METDETESFFFEQTTFRKRQRRYKKHPDDLPPDLKFAHHNPRIAAILANKDREQNKEDVFCNDGLGNKSLMPHIKRNFSKLKQSLESLNDQDPQKYRYDDAKLSAEGLLQQLTRQLYFFEGTQPSLPRSLENELGNQYKDLIISSHYVPRDWQISANKDEFLKKQEQQNELRLQEERDNRSETSIGLDDDGRESLMESKLGRAKSKLTSRTNTTLADISEMEEGKSKERSRTDVPPTIIAPKQESKDRLQQSSKAKSRLDKFKGLPDQREPGRTGSVYGGRGSRLRPEDGTTSAMGETASDGARSALGTSREVGYYAIISFQLSSKLCEDKGWVLQPGLSGADGSERDTVLEWATQRLQTVLKQRKEEMKDEHESGQDRPIALRYYGDSRKEQIDKYKRSQSSGSFITNRSGPVWKGEKPRIPPMEPKTKGKDVFIATTSDGSTTVFYPTGRPAIVTSRSGCNKPGYYTAVYNNNTASTMLATFTPSGAGCVYHGNGNINFLCNDDGGTLADTAGTINKRWTWPPGNAKLPATLAVPVMRCPDWQTHFGEQMNPSITLRCVNHAQMHLFFTCGKESAKINVGISTEKETPPTREELGHLVSGYKFESKTAEDFSKPFKPKPTKTRTKATYKGKGISWNPVLETGPTSQATSPPGTTPHSAPPLAPPPLMALLAMSGQPGGLASLFSPQQESTKLSQSMPHKQLKKASSLMTKLCSQPNTPEGPGLRKLSMLNQGLLRTESAPPGGNALKLGKESRALSPLVEPPVVPSAPPSPPPLDPSTLDTKTFCWASLQSSGDPFGRMPEEEERSVKGSPCPSSKGRRNSARINMQAKLASLQQKAALEGVSKSTDEYTGPSRPSSAAVSAHLIPSHKAGSSTLSSASAEDMQLNGNIFHSASSEDIAPKAVSKRLFSRSMENFGSSPTHPSHSLAPLNYQSSPLDPLISQVPQSSSSLAPPTSHPPASFSLAPPNSQAPPSSSLAPPTSQAPPSSPLAPPPSQAPSSPLAPSTSQVPPPSSLAPPTSQVSPSSSLTPPTSQTPPSSSSAPPTSQTPPSSSSLAPPSSAVVPPISVAQQTSQSPLFTSESASKSLKGSLDTAVAVASFRTLKGKSRSKASHELQKILDYPEPTENDADADKELFKLQRKIKQVAENWLEHYRMAMGLGSPLLDAMRAVPSRKARHSRSAKAGGGRVVIEPSATQVAKASASVRAPSAPAGQRVYRPPSSVPSQSEIGGMKSTESKVNFDDHPEEIEPDEYVESLAGGHPSSAGSLGRCSSRALSAPQRSATWGQQQQGSESYNPALSMCPVAVRMAMLGEERVTCRCSRHKIPTITDVEYDQFVMKLSPPKQLIVVAVRSSLFPDASRSAEEMLERLNVDKNRNRSKPCLQSRTDPSRVFWYDMAIAADLSDHTQPLLLRRHNVVPGMFLIYESGQLIFCDHIFNGYGNARKDLQKQLLHSQRMASIGHFLPKDFKFSPQHGRHGPRAAWGGEIGGVERHGGLQKRPSLTSLSSSDSKENLAPNMISGVSCSAKYISVRLSSGKYPQMSKSQMEMKAAVAAAASKPVPELALHPVPDTTMNKKSITKATSPKKYLEPSPSNTPRNSTADMKVRSGVSSTIRVKAGVSNVKVKPGVSKVIV